MFSYFLKNETPTGLSCSFIFLLIPKASSYNLEIFRKKIYIHEVKMSQKSKKKS